MGKSLPIPGVGQWIPCKSFATKATTMLMVLRQPAAPSVLGSLIGIPSRDVKVGLIDATTNGWIDGGWMAV